MASPVVGSSFVQVVGSETLDPQNCIVPYNFPWWGIIPPVNPYVQPYIQGYAPPVFYTWPDPRVAELEAQVARLKHTNRRLHRLLAKARQKPTTEGV